MSRPSPAFVFGALLALPGAVYSMPMIGYGGAALGMTLGRALLGRQPGDVFLWSFAVVFALAFGPVLQGAAVGWECARAWAAVSRPRWSPIGRLSTPAAVAGWTVLEAIYWKSTVWAFAAQIGFIAGGGGAWLVARLAGTPL